MIVVKNEFYTSFAHKETILKKIKRKLKNMIIDITDNMIIYQYDDGRIDN